MPADAADCQMREKTTQNMARDHSAGDIFTPEDSSYCPFYPLILPAEKI